MNQLILLADLKIRQNIKPRYYLRQADKNLKTNKNKLNGRRRQRKNKATKKFFISFRFK